MSIMSLAPILLPSLVCLILVHPFGCTHTHTEHTKSTLNSFAPKLSMGPNWPLDMGGGAFLTKPANLPNRIITFDPVSKLKIQQYPSNIFIFVYVRLIHMTRMIHITYASLTTALVRNAWYACPEPLLH